MCLNRKLTICSRPGSPGDIRTGARSPKPRVILALIVFLVALRGSRKGKRRTSTFNLLRRLAELDQREWHRLQAPGVTALFHRSGSRHVRLRAICKGWRLIHVNASC